MFKETFLSDDKDIPDRIEHGCDIIVGDDGELEQYYNYFVYRFSGVGHGLWARAYVDTMDHVTLYGSVSEVDKRLIQKDSFDTDRGREIIRYLQRRYGEVRLGAAETYVFPWIA
jgi:hypothetical protein